MRPALHFVGFKTTGQLWLARQVLGAPDFIHRFWDQRAKAEVAPGDTVIYATGDDLQPVRVWSYDDSAQF